jgi:hypothetical protein
MKIIITESQYKKILREEDELLLKGQQLEKVLHIPSMKYFNYDWDFLQEFLEFKGYPPYIIGGDLNLSNTSIESLGNLTSVEGDLVLLNTSIESLGNLESVGGYLDLEVTPIESLGKLTSVGGDLDLYDTPLSKKYTREQIRQMVDVGGRIYM